MVDNFNLIGEFIQFQEPGDCYMIQILQRKKDNPDLKRNMNVIDVFFLYDRHDLFERKERIIKTCTDNNARAYIHLNKRNTKTIALHTMAKIAGYILTGDYKAVKNAYMSAAGEHHSDLCKKWIIDIDNDRYNWDYEEGANFYGLYYTLIDLKPVGDKEIIRIPTKHGFHMITKPFQLDEFQKRFPGIDVHKDNPTILYIP